MVRPHLRAWKSERNDSVQQENPPACPSASPPVYRPTLRVDKFSSLYLHHLDIHAQHLSDGGRCVELCCPLLCDLFTLGEARVPRDDVIVRTTVARRLTSRPLTTHLCVITAAAGQNNSGRSVNYISSSLCKFEIGHIDNLHCHTWRVALGTPTPPRIGHSAQSVFSCCASFDDLCITHRVNQGYVLEGNADHLWPVLFSL